LQVKAFYRIMVEERLSGKAREWAREDATDDPAAIARAEQELAQFEAALNANRPPDKPVFP